MRHRDDFAVAPRAAPRQAGSFQLVEQDTGSHTVVVATPGHEPRECEIVPESTSGPTLLGAGHRSRDKTCKCAQKCLKSAPFATTREQVQLVADIGEPIDAHTIFRGQAPQQRFHDVPIRVPKE